MARMYGHAKGISRSALPYKRCAPSWSKTTPEDVTRSIVQLAKKGMTPSQIGVVLRDSMGIPRVKSITGTLITRILRKKGLASEIPEDLYFLMKKAVTMRKHFDKARADKDCKFRLTLCESKIHRLARYYRKTRKLPPTWKYTPAKASAAVA
eukprot:Gregarina_sp_Poly_1__7571@NODE_423_length_8651_cov_79_752796_g345_i0_p2_GENE_NODE_423_length_8651_cov_79_752796_g345_i0NODE_423_length_8651_cov_79_752796_g345_i0_p2_ORF_typecomplete_len152_score21_03Ribosomal_S13_N/PF08069_12/3_6e29Ribosomal_S13_N/PF08069_12/1_1e03Ribosomal_S15/PF00312_22/1_1e18Myb_DNAbind_4/PF13837_6/0_15YflT/PF11181_8/0_14_NODE_423_length_8651_cov_79_752796_g345_i08261281